MPRITLNLPVRRIDADWLWPGFGDVSDAFRAGREPRKELTEDGLMPSGDTCFAANSANRGGTQVLGGLPRWRLSEPGLRNLSERSTPPNRC